MAIDLKTATLFDILKMGGRIEFPGGYYLHGDPDYGYIDIGTEDYGHGSSDLTPAGLEEALRDLAEIARDRGHTLDGKVSRARAA